MGLRNPSRRRVRLRLQRLGALSIGNADVDQTDVVGVDAEIDLEALLALEPDLVIGFGNADGSGWTWWDDQVTERATDIAPFLGIQFSGRPVEDVIEEYRALAGALGADVDSADIRAQAERFDERLDTLRQIAQDAPGLRIIPLNGSDQLWVGNASLGQLALLEELGFTIAGPDPGERGWTELSWETVGEYPADVILSYSGSHEKVQDNPVYTRLPAVEAGQVVEWDDKRPFTYSSYVEWFDDLIAVLSDAEIVAPPPNGG